MSKCAICSPVWRILYHVITSCKGPLFKVVKSGAPHYVLLDWKNRHDYCQQNVMLSLWINKRFAGTLRNKTRNALASSDKSIHKDESFLKARKNGSNLRGLSLNRKTLFAVGSKLNRLLQLLKQTFGKRSKGLLVGCKVMVPPILEYVCQMWNPYQTYLIEKLERVQISWSSLTV